MEERMDPKGNPTGGGGEVRRRQREGTDHRIATAAMQIMRSSGPNAVTMEAVSALSGVAKTTLYRRYSDRFDLLEGVAGQVAPVAAPPEGLTAESLTQILKGLEETFESQVGYAFVGHLLASDEDFMVAWRQKIIKPRIDLLRDFFARGVGEGVLKADVDYQMVTEFILGGVVMCDALRGKVPQDWAISAVSILWPIISTSSCG
jgi:AcrR family transcriptional regulator